MQHSLKSQRGFSLPGTDEQFCAQKSVLTTLAHQLATNTFAVNFATCELAS